MTPECVGVGEPGEVLRPIRLERNDVPQYNGSDFVERVSSILHELDRVVSSFVSVLVRSCVCRLLS